MTSTNDSTTSPFAIIDSGNEITQLLDLTDAERDELARKHGRALVYLPMGGAVGDMVRVSEDGEAAVVPLAARILREEPDGLAATELHETMCVRDDSEQVWWPSDEAAEEIDASGDREATALRICREQPMRGEWRA